MKTQKHTRIFSILLAVCMLVSLLPAGMLSASAVTSDPETQSEAPGFTVATLDLAYGDTFTPIYTGLDGYTAVLSTESDLITINDDGTVTAGYESGSATLTLSCEEDPSTIIAEMTINVTAIMHFNYMKFADFGVASGYLTANSTSTSQMKSGSADDIGATSSYGWMVGTTSGFYRAWQWTTNAGFGPYLRDGSAGAYATMIIDVPVAGEYRVISAHTAWASGGSYDLYIAPESVADANVVADEYKVNRAVINHHADPADTGREDYLGTVELATGTYKVAYRAVTTGGFFIRGLKLCNVLGPVEVDATELTMPEEIELAVGESAFMNGTTNPPAAIGWVEYESSDETVATVEDGVVTAHKAGTATITTTTESGLSATTEVQVYQSYDYLFKSFTSGTDFRTFVSETYDESKAVAGCAPFRYIYTNAARVQLSDATYGTFFFSAVRANQSYYTCFEVELESGIYDAAAIINSTTSTAPANVYLAKVPEGTTPTVGAAPDLTVIEKPENLILEIPQGGATSAAIFGIPVEGTKTVSVEGGKYYLFFREIAGPSYYYLAMDSFTLRKLGDIPVQSFDLSASASQVQVGTPVTITATNILPAFKADDAEFTWSSSDEDVATVANDGTVTTKKAGVVTITAEVDGVSRSIDILVYASVLDYNFSRTGVEGNIAQMGADYCGSYAGSASINSAPWQIYPANQKVLNGLPYGSFFFGSDDGTIDTAVLKIEVAEAGKYVPGAYRYNYGSSTSATVHIAPTDAADKVADEYYVYTITECASGTTELECADTSIMLKAGEYYITFTNAVPGTNANRYLNLHDFYLYKVGDYVPTKVSEISLSTDLPAIAIGEIATISASVAPSEADNKNVVWESSNDNIATVADGVVTGKANGVATITATAADGSGVVGSIDIYVGGTYVYDFVKSIQAQYSSGTLHVTSTPLASGYDASIAAGSAPWRVDSRNNANFTYHSANAALGTSLFGLAPTTSASYVRLKIKVEKGGVYTAALRYSDYTTTAPAKVYLAPVAEGTANITSETNMIFDIQPSATAWTQKAATADDLYLSAGEYYLYFLGEQTVAASLFMHYFSLTKTADTGVTLTDGASMRTTNPQGLRFYGQLDKTTDLYKSGKITEYGIILLPEADLNGENTNLIIDYTASNGHKVAKVEAVKLYDETPEMNEFTAVLYNIPEIAYTTEIAARTYAIITDAAGAEHVVYSDIVSARSIYQVAVELVAANKEPSSVAIAQKIIDTVEAAQN